jgi:hypothetical protein
MRIKIKLAIVLASSLICGISADQFLMTEPSVTKFRVAVNNQRVIVDPNLQGMVDSWAKGDATNGLVCGVVFARSDGISERPPIFYVNIINTTTNFISGCLNLPFEAFASIELFDSDGKQATKTTAGQRVGTWTQKQIEDWFNETHRKRSQAMTKSGSITSTLFPLLYEQVSGKISIFQMFQLNVAGEYSLHLKMRFVQVAEDASGQFTFQTTWLPEVVARVQIRPEDIPPENLSPSGQTNSSTK